jgi:hypothetical protein
MSSPWRSGTPAVPASSKPRYLAGRGADLNWRAPWSGQTPLDAASDKHQRAIVARLTEKPRR